MSWKFVRGSENRRFRPPPISKFCEDARLIRQIHALIRHRLLPYKSFVPAILQDLRPSPSFTKSSMEKEDNRNISKFTQSGLLRQNRLCSTLFTWAVPARAGVSVHTLAGVWPNVVVASRILVAGVAAGLTTFVYVCQNKEQQEDFEVARRSALRREINCSKKFESLGFWFAFGAKKKKRIKFFLLFFPLFSTAGSSPFVFAYIYMHTPRH